MFEESSQITPRLVHGCDVCRIDATQRSLPPVVRASVHYYNSGEELHRFVAALAECIGAGEAEAEAAAAKLRGWLLRNKH